MKSTLSSIQYKVRLDEASAIDATSAHGGNAMRVQPVEMVVFTDEQGNPWRIEVRGPKVKADGSVGAAHFMGLVSIDGERYPALPAEYREVVAQVTGYPL